MRTPRAAAAFAVACALVLGGCAEDGEPRSEPTRSPTPVPTQDAPSTTPADAPTRPALPDAAKQATPAGAEAFIEYYWALVHYGELTGDVAPLRTVSGEGCGGCDNGMRAIRRHYRSGGHLTGGGYGVTFQRTEVADVENDAAYVVGAEISVSSDEQEVVGGDDSSETLKPGVSEWKVVATWATDHWRLDIMDLTR